MDAITSGIDGRLPIFLTVATTYIVLNTWIFFNKYSCREFCLVHCVFRSPWLYPNFIFYLSSVGKQFKKDCDFVHSVTKDIIKQRKDILVSDNTRIHTNCNVKRLIGATGWCWCKLSI